MAIDRRKTVKDHIWEINPFKLLAYRILCTYNFMKATWTKQSLAFQVVPEGGKARVHVGIIIESDGRKYVTTPVLDVYLTKEQLYILAGSASRAMSFVDHGRIE